MWKNNFDVYNVKKSLDPRWEYLELQYHNLVDFWYYFISVINMYIDYFISTSGEISVTIASGRWHLGKIFNLQHHLSWSSLEVLYTSFFWIHWLNFWSPSSLELIRSNWHLIFATTKVDFATRTWMKLKIPQQESRNFCPRCSRFTKCWKQYELQQWPPRY